MRRPEEINTVAMFHEMGLTAPQIARIMRLPSTTVWNWLNGRLPRRLESSDPTCPSCGHAHRVRSEREASYAYLLGVYLGDGHIAPFPRTTCLRVYLDSHYPRIVATCVAALRRLLPQNKVQVFRRRPHNCVVVCCYSRQWPCLLPQHGAGSKHERSIVLAGWQREITSREPKALIRGLIHSDGCRYTNRVRRRGRTYAYPSYNFSNLSEGIKQIFCEHLDLLDIEWRRNDPKEIAITRRASVAKLDAFVGPKR
jgi:hypothetical protein